MLELDMTADSGVFPLTGGMRGSLQLCESTCFVFEANGN